MLSGPHDGVLTARLYCVGCGWVQSRLPEVGSTATTCCPISATTCCCPSTVISCGELCELGNACLAHTTAPSDWLNAISDLPDPPMLMINRSCRSA